MERSVRLMADNGDIFAAALAVCRTTEVTCLYSKNKESIFPSLNL